MKKIPDPKGKLIFAGVFFLALFLLWRFQIPCIWRYLFHIPCPGCGMTRAWLSALRLDFSAAFRYHAMFWSVPIFALYWLYDGRPFSRKLINRGVLILLGIGVLANWIWGVLTTLDFY